MLVNCPKEGHQKVYKWREFLGFLYEWQYVKEKNIVLMKLEFFRVIVGKLQGLTIKMDFYDPKKISEMNISIDWYYQVYK